MHLRCRRSLGACCAADQCPIAHPCLTRLGEAEAAGRHGRWLRGAGQRKRRLQCSAVAGSEAFVVSSCATGGWPLRPAEPTARGSMLVAHLCAEGRLASHARDLRLRTVRLPMVADAAHVARWLILPLTEGALDDSENDSFTWECASAVQIAKVESLEGTSPQLKVVCGSHSPHEGAWVSDYSHHSNYYSVQAGYTWRLYTMGVRNTLFLAVHPRGGAVTPPPLPRIQKPTTAKPNQISAAAYNI